MRLDALDKEIAAHQENGGGARSADRPGARRACWRSTSSAKALQAQVREREKAIEAGRQVILRLLGEASTLKNQLAQIEEYLAGIERDTARAQREEQVAASEIERLEAAREAAFGDAGAAAAGAGDRHGRAAAHGRGAGGAPQERGRTARRDRRAEERSVARCGRARNRSSRCWRTAPIPPSR